MPRDTSEIGSAETPGRSERASAAAPPSRPAPAHSTNPEIGPEKVRRKRARYETATTWRSSASANNHEIGGGDASGDSGPAALRTPRNRTPGIPNIGAINDDADRGEGQSRFDLHRINALAAPTIHEVVAQLRALQKRRQLCITEVNGAVSRIDHLIAGVIGFDQTEKSKKAAFDRARTFRLAVEKGGEGQHQGDTQPRPALSALIPTIIVSAASRPAWTNLRKTIEAETERLAELLPGQAFIKSVAGFGPLGYGVLQGWCTDPIGEYRTVSGLWKRLGVAVIDGHRQKGIAGKRKDDEEARKLFFPAKARGDVYTFLSDTMLRAQWRAERLACVPCDKPTSIVWKEQAPVCKECGLVGSADDVILAHPIGHYGEVYARRKAHTAPRILATENLDSKDQAKWTPARCDNDARRIMSKALLRDLWRACNGLPPRGFAD